MCSCSNMIPIPKKVNDKLMVFEAVCRSCFKKRKTSPMTLEEFKEIYISY